MILSFTIDKLAAGVHAADIVMILPDVGNKERGVLYTGSHPEGVTADQSAVTLLCQWSNIIEGAQNECMDSDSDNEGDTG
jgi:hypothetical protein